MVPEFHPGLDPFARCFAMELGRRVPSTRAGQEPAPDERAAADQHPGQQSLEEVVATEPIHPGPLGDDHQDDEADHSTDDTTEHSHIESLERKGRRRTLNPTGQGEDGVDHSPWGLGSATRGQRRRHRDSSDLQLARP